MTTADTAVARPVTGLQGLEPDPLVGGPFAGLALGAVGAEVIMEPPTSGHRIDKRLNAAPRE